MCSTETLPAFPEPVHNLENMESIFSSKIESFDIFTFAYIFDVNCEYIEIDFACRDPICNDAIF